MKILWNNVAPGGVQLICPKCLSGFVIEKNDDITMEDKHDSYDETNKKHYYIKCPCCGEKAFKIGSIWENGLVVQNELEHVFNLEGERRRLNYGKDDY